MSHDDPDTIRAEIDRTRQTQQRRRPAGRARPTRQRRPSTGRKGQPDGQLAQGLCDGRRRTLRRRSRNRRVQYCRPRPFRRRGGTVDRERAYPRQSLAAGLIAFGVGALLASLAPTSRAEQRLAIDLRDRAEPLVDDAKSAALHDSADHLTEPARDAAASVRASADDAVATVKDDAKTGVQEVRSAR
jgi:hypothetical protein